MGKNMQKILLPMVMLLITSGTYAQTQVLAAWAARTSTPTYSTLLASSNATDLSASVFFTADLTGTVAANWKWDGFSTSATTPDLNQYGEFALTPAPGKKISATTFGITMDYDQDTDGSKSRCVY